MTTTVTRLSQKIRFVFASQWFFYATVALFSISSIWVATASLYPMAFDEEFHLGLIKIYAAHWLPYGIENTRDMAQYGAAMSDPSYLFHYLMSFPYRLLDWLGLSQTAIIICLRLLNVAMVVTSLFIYRKALLAANVSKPIAHGVIAAFTLIPILPMMAGQLNYDNLLLIMVALSFLLTINITKFVQRNSTVPVMSTLALLGVVLITLPIKYAFFPIALVIFGWLIFLLWRCLREKGFQIIAARVLKDFKKISTLGKVSLAILFIVGAFFSARYVENYIRYDSLIPSCHVVFDEDACMDFGPWARDYLYKKQLDPGFKPESYPAYFTTEWVPGMIFRLTFTLAGKTNGFQTKQPLPLLWPIACVFLLTGLVALLRYGRHIIRDYPYAALTILATLAYIGMLSIKLYLGYTKTGIPAAINGRYLLPLIPFMIAVFAQAIFFAAKRLKITAEIVLVVTAMLVITLFQGGGIVTYIVLGESHWFYPGWGQTSHDFLHDLLSPITWQYRWFK